MKEKQARELLKRYRKELGSDEENKAVESWINQELSASIWDKTEEERIRFGEMLKDRIDVERLKNAGVIWPWRRVAVAAAVFFCLGTGFYFYQSAFRKNKLNGQSYTQQTINPGGNKATLTLGDGKTIDLNDTGSGEIAEEAGIRISKTKDGQLVYNLSDVNKQGATSNKTTMYNTVATPKGGQYQIRLPDGSKVWLNAASSLKYLASFSAWNERRVELSGEAYFEVAKDKKHPFIVKTENQEVKVLGTHFNINSYQDEPVTKTTLLEGSVQVTALQGHQNKSAIVVLKPGQEAVLNSNNIQVSSEDTEDAIAWKDGYFMFNNESLESVMRKISRWYDIQVEFKDDSTRGSTFYGRMSKFSKVDQILKKLELTKEVRFEIKDHKILVLKN